MTLRLFLNSEKRDRNSKVKFRALLMNRKRSGLEHHQWTRSSTVTSYVKGQLVRPLSGAGRWLLFGIVGGVLVGAGVVFTLLGLLRLLQTELSGISGRVTTFVAPVIHRARRWSRITCRDIATN